MKLERKRLSKSGDRYSAPPIRNWSVVSALGCGTALAILSSSMVGVAMPRMLNTFSVSIDTLTWIAIVYSIASILTAAMSGWLSALLGRKQVYILALVVFTGASLLCGTARSFELILVGRILQGMSAGALPTVGHAFLFSTFSNKRQPTAVGVYMIAPLGAGGFGPVLSAWLTDAWDWPWVFFMMAVLAAVSVPLASRFLPGSRQEKRTRGRLDVGGLLLLILSLTTLQIFLLRGPIEGWFDSSFIVTMGLVALGSLILMVGWELYVDEPVLNFRVLTNTPYTAGVCLVFLWGMVFFCTPFLLPLYLQQLRGYPVLDAGLILLPQAITMIVLTPLVGHLYNVINRRCIVASGMGLLIAGYLNMVRFTMETGVLQMLLAFILVGAGLACLYTALTTITMGAVPSSHLAPATSFYGLMRRVGANIGFALISTQVTKLKAIHYEALANFTTSGAIGIEQALLDLRGHFSNTGLPMHLASLYEQTLIRERVIAHSTVLAYSDVFLIFALLFLCGSPLILLLGRPTAPRHTQCQITTIESIDHACT